MSDNNRRTEDAELSLFRRFLKRFRICKNKERNLQERLLMLKGYDTYKGQQMTGMPGSGDISNTPLAFQIDKDELSARIAIQNERSVDVYLTVAEIIGYLDEDTDEREVLERKYIDCQGELRICREMNISRSSLYRYAKAGLMKLLTYEKIRETLSEYAKVVVARERMKEENETD